MFVAPEQKEHRTDGGGAPVRFKLPALGMARLAPPCDRLKFFDASFLSPIGQQRKKSPGGHPRKDSVQEVDCRSRPGVQSGIAARQIPQIHDRRTNLSRPVRRQAGAEVLMRDREQLHPVNQSLGLQKTSRLLKRGRLDFKRCHASLPADSPCKTDRVAAKSRCGVHDKVSAFAEAFDGLMRERSKSRGRSCPCRSGILRFRRRGHRRSLRKSRRRE